uniref:Endonuclease/exonuclease/phosphatase domain-containing protein n=1 Tax=Tetranychus urticae TaxID=32264 RepID=T1KCL3_TETUR
MPIILISLTRLVGTAVNEPKVLKHYTEKAGLMVVISRQPNCFRGMTETVNDLVFVNHAMFSGFSLCETTEHLGGSDHFMIRLQL